MSDKFIDPDFEVLHGFKEELAFLNSAEESAKELPRSKAFYRGVLERFLSTVEFSPEGEITKLLFARVALEKMLRRFHLDGSKSQINAIERCLAMSSAIFLETTTRDMDLELQRQTGDGKHHSIIHQRSKELAAWQDRQFGAEPNTAFRMLQLGHGVSEEYAEYVRAQNTWRNPQDFREIALERGDIACYLSQLFHLHQLAFVPVLRLSYGEMRGLAHPHISELIGVLSHVVLKRSQNSRGLESDNIYRSMICVLGFLIVKGCQITVDDFMVRSEQVMARAVNRAD